MFLVLIAPFFPVLCVVLYLVNYGICAHSAHMVVLCFLHCVFLQFDLYDNTALPKITIQLMSATPPPGQVKSSPWGRLQRAT